MDRATYHLRKPSTPPARPSARQPTRPAVPDTSGSSVRRSLATFGPSGSASADPTHNQPRTFSSPGKTTTSRTFTSPRPPRSRSADRYRDELEPPSSSKASTNLFTEAKLSPDELLKMMDLCQTTYLGDVSGEEGVQMLIRQVRNVPQFTSNSHNNNSLYFNDSFMYLNSNSSFGGRNESMPRFHDQFEQRVEMPTAPISDSTTGTELVDELRAKVRELRELKFRKPILEYFNERNKMLDPELLNSTVSQLHDIGMLLDVFTNSQIPGQLAERQSLMEAGGLLIPCPIEERAHLTQLLKVLFKLNDTVETTLRSLGSDCNLNNAKIIELLRKRLDEEFSQLVKESGTVEKLLGDYVSLEEYYQKILSHYKIAEAEVMKWQKRQGEDEGH